MPGFHKSVPMLPNVLMLCLGHAPTALVVALVLQATPSEAAQQVDAAATAAHSQPTAASEATAQAAATTAATTSSDDDSWCHKFLRLDWEPHSSQLKTAQSFEGRQHPTSSSTPGMLPEHDSSSTASTRSPVPGSRSGCHSEPGTSTGTRVARRQVRQMATSELWRMGQQQQ